ncbi:MAG TPA: HAMP domain-containing protein, partial [Blastocatellia bacterium]|nr:HAMP domain-containing protein [Blastocatellia bacterium]
MSLIQRIKIRTLLKISCGLVFSSITGLTLVALHGFSSEEIQVKTIMEKQYAKVNLISTVIDRANDVTNATMSMALTSDPGQIHQYRNQVAANRQKISETLEKVKTMLFSEQDKQLMDAYTAKRAAYVESYMKVGDLAEAGDRQGALRELNEHTLPAKKEYMESLNSMVSDSQDDMNAAAKEAVASAASAREWMIWSSAIVFIGACVFAWWIMRRITSPLIKSVEMLNELSGGHLDRRLKLGRGDEIGQMADAMDSFADMLQKNVVGSLQRIAEGDVSFDVIPQSEGDEIAPALQETITSLRGLTAETEKMTKWAREGKLSNRGDATNFRGEYRKLIEEINSTVEAIVAPVNEAAAVLEKVAGCDLSARIIGNYNGDHAKIKNALNQAVANLDNTMNQIAVGAEQ